MKTFESPSRLVLLLEGKRGKQLVCYDLVHAVRVMNTLQTPNFGSTPTGFTPLKLRDITCTAGIINSLAILPVAK